MTAKHTPGPPTAEELAEVLRGLLDSSDNARRAWVNKASELLKRWDDAREVQP